MAVPPYPARGRVHEGVVDAAVVQPLGERLADVGHRAAVRLEVVVDDGVVHAVEAAVGEPGREVLGVVQAGGHRRVRHLDEAGDHMGTAPYQVGGELHRGQPAADEQGPEHVDPGQVRRVRVQGQALHGQPAEGAGGQVEVQFRPGLDLLGGVVVADDGGER